MNPIYISKEHEVFFVNVTKRLRWIDIYRVVFFYLLGLTPETREHITELYDFETNFISLDNLDAPWQTRLTRKVCSMAYNLYNGYCDDDKPGKYTPHDIFHCSLAPYFVCALRMRYADSFDMLADGIVAEIE